MTLPGEGYRFVAPVEHVGGSVASPEDSHTLPAPPGPLRPWLLWAAGAAVLAALAVIGVGTQDRARRLRAIGADEASLRRIAELDFPLFSVAPDGRRLVFMDAESRRLQLKNIENGETRVLVSTRGTITGDTWSPDGQRFAFVTHPEGGGHQLETVDVASAERRVVRFADSIYGLPRPVQWPSEERLLGLVTLPENRVQIVFVSLTDGELTPLRTTVAQTYPLVQLSPDGRLLAYASRRNSNWDIYVAPVDQAAAEIRLTEDPSLEISPLWSPDGRYLLFARSGGSGFDLWALEIEPLSGTRVSDPFLITQLGLGKTPGWSLTLDGELMISRSDPPEPDFFARY